MFSEPWKDLGIEDRHISQVRMGIPTEYQGREADAFRDKKVFVDTSDIDWADVVVVRRYYNTVWKCLGKPCPVTFPDEEAGHQHEVNARHYGPTQVAENRWACKGEGGCRFLAFGPDDSMAHQKVTGHRVDPQDHISRSMWPALIPLADKAIVYDTDDDHFNIRNWNGYYADVLAEQDLIESMARRADLVTVSSPVLAKRYARFNDTVRVVRNAVIPEMYVQNTDRPPGDLPRLVYYGGSARIRDYAGQEDFEGRLVGGQAKGAVDRFRDQFYSVFMGWGGEPEMYRVIGSMFDEVRQTVVMSQFPEALCNAHPDIGLSPLAGDDFDAAKSELHWLEYSLAGAATIAQDFKFGGPYDVIRHGKDGMLARGRGEWEDALRYLLRNPAARSDMAALAKERVLLEYDYRKRAAEWADAFRWAAENRGRNVGKGADIPRPHSVAHILRAATSGILDVSQLDKYTTAAEIAALRGP